MDPGMTGLTPSEEEGGSGNGGELWGEGASSSYASSSSSPGGGRVCHQSWMCWLAGESGGSPSYLHPPSRTGGRVQIAYSLGGKGNGTTSDELGGGKRRLRG